jgi:hypothetical protein
MYFSTYQIASILDFQPVNLKCKERNSFAGYEILFIFLVNLGNPYKIYIEKAVHIAVLEQHGEQPKRALCNYPPCGDNDTVFMVHIAVLGQLCEHL